MTMVDPAFNCESALNCAPYVISSLGHLLLISAETDFQIDHLPENATLKYLRYSDSFRACLLQVSNDVGLAFDDAHHNMEKIRLNSCSIDRHVRKAVKFINEGTEDELPIVHKCLESIDKQSDECVKAAKTITHKFKGVVRKMNELQEACTGAKGRYNRDQKETEIVRKTAAEKLKHVEKRLQDMKVRYDEEKITLERLDKEYEIAINSYPSTWKIMLSGSVDQIGLLARDITVSLTPAFLPSVGLPVSSTPCIARKKEDPASLAKATISNDEAKAYLAARDILKHAVLLLSFGNNDQNGIEVVKEWFQENQQKLRESPSDAMSVKKAIKLCVDGVERCENILNCFKKPVNAVENAAIRNTAKWTDDKVTKNRCKKFHEDAVFFTEEARNALPTLYCSVNDDVPQPNGGKLTAMLLLNAEEKRQQARKILLTCYERYERCQEIMLQEKREMEKILDDLAKFDHRTLDLSKIREVLHNGVGVLCDMKDHWRRFKGMFQWLRNLINDRLRPSLEFFHITSEVKNKGNLAKKVIIDEAEEASQIAFMVQNTSALYVDVSQKFLLNQLSMLNSMASLDAESDREKMEETRRKMQKNFTQAQDGIQLLAKERRSNIREKIMKQQDNI